MAACLFAITFAAVAPTTVGAKDLAWSAVDSNVRWAPLEVPASTKIGFTILAPEQTGVAFTNSLDEKAAAANRVLLNGSGVAVGDFDNDGWPDIFFCSLNGRNTLYKNLGNWKFTDVTEQAGLKRDQRYYRGAVFADVNGDGWPDLLLCVVGGGVQCLLNDTHGKFSDVTVAARTASDFGSMTLALADVDGNGTLDLYVANNRTEDIRDRGQVNLQMINGQMTVPPALRDRLAIVNSEVLEYGEPDQLYLNDGQGHFAPMSWTGGRFRNEDGSPLIQPPLDWGLSAAFHDLNDDGFPDLYVCNDFWTPDRIWLNDGKGRFRAAPRLALRNTSASSMGVDFADIDRDGRVDFFVVDMLSRDLMTRKHQKLAQPSMSSSVGAIDDRPQFMRNTLFLNRGDGTFAEIANSAGVAASEWSWSPAFLDVDLDGYEDLLITSGHARDVQDLDAAARIRARQHPWPKFASEQERQKAFTQELMEHMRLYPELDTPIVAFRNRGDLRFDDMTANWGTDQLAVHHAIAFADFDGDGDLDFVVNNLGSVAGIYRNDTSAPRVAVRLRGLRPNTQGIGAKIKLLGGAVPMQSQEIISGGRYMSGSEPMLVFAAGTNSSGMRLEVKWRSGKSSVVANVAPNRLYEIGETGAALAPVTNAPPVKSLFEDVNHLLQHTHHEEAFDDFERQPLLPRRLSQLGPGVSWFDVDGDGHDDLLIASGKGGKLACFRNNGRGGFEPIEAPPFDRIAPRDQTTVLGRHVLSTSNSHLSTLLLVGSANYEDGSTNANGVEQFGPDGKVSGNIFPAVPASTGPLALADVDGDGNLDLFVGGRVIPGRYPEAASSRLYHYDGTVFKIDEPNTKTLEQVGLVSGAVWSDLDGDGFPELLLACEWGPLRIFRNSRGQLATWNAPVTLNSQPSTLNELTGWWNGVAVGDFDGDGRLDIVASNWGLNSDYAASRGRPLKLYYGDLMQRGVVDLIETEWDPRLKAFAPRRRLDFLGRFIPSLMAAFPSHRNYGDASIEKVLSPNAARMRTAEVTTLASMLFLNRGDHFEAVPLPAEAQRAPAFGVSVADFDGDGREDIFLSQNFFANTAETPRLDAGRGVLLRGDGTGKFEALSGQRSGIEIYGEQRASAVADYDGDGRVDLAVAQNGTVTKLFHNAGGAPGIRVHLAGPPGNPDGIGAALRLKFGTRLGPAREIHAGSGYWSQDSSVQVMATPERATELWVRWPGGGTSTLPLPPDAREITNRITAAQALR